MTQHTFSDGTYVIHGIKINGHKYSAWYGKDGQVFSAERFTKDGNRTVHVPLRKQVEVEKQLNKVGKAWKDSQTTKSV